MDLLALHFFSWQELVVIESGLFILMKWVEWLSPFQRYLQCSLSYRWLPYITGHEWFFAELIVFFGIITNKNIS
uniref:Uncharacterized protein n=1 Tax=Brassica oleracea TaxID=3712 RepID=A0A3P6HI47_BRAOL|nr:unnamed protein product [Brassica oleracea]